ncbi:hypothetical protein BC829DRAFT_431529 [Chytridium lagenaria]|nr:hypothetical protein BC829DRAFT_431529 [Chytridium lagenaria]
MDLANKTTPVTCVHHSVSSKWKLKAFSIQPEKTAPTHPPRRGYATLPTGGVFVRPSVFAASLGKRAGGVVVEQNEGWEGWEGGGGGEGKERGTIWKETAARFERRPAGPRGSTSIELVGRTSFSSMARSSFSVDGPLSYPHRTTTQPPPPLPSLSVSPRSSIAASSPTSSLALLRRSLPVPSGPRILPVPLSNASNASNASQSQIAQSPDASSVAGSVTSLAGSLATSPSLACVVEDLSRQVAELKAECESLKRRGEVVKGDEGVLQDDDDDDDVYDDEAEVEDKYDALAVPSVIPIDPSMIVTAPVPPPPRKSGPRVDMLRERFREVEREIRTGGSDMGSRSSTVSSVEVGGHCGGVGVEWRLGGRMLLDGGGGGGCGEEEVGFEELMEACILHVEGDREFFGTLA